MQLDDPAVLSLRTPARPTMRRRARCISSAMMGTVILAASVSIAPAAVADSTDNLRSAVAQLHGASCAPLRPDPTVQQAADFVNRSTDIWIDHTAKTPPITEPLPLLKDLGYGGTKATLVQGVGVTEADAIKGLLLQGYKLIPDCSYTDMGVSFKKNDTSPYFIAAVVLAGP